MGSACICWGNVIWMGNDGDGPGVKGPIHDYVYICVSMTRVTPALHPPKF